MLTGIVRGGGDTRFVFINDLISIWCIVLPLFVPCGVQVGVVAGGGAVLPQCGSDFQVPCGIHKGKQILMDKENDTSELKCSAITEKERR